VPSPARLSGLHHVSALTAQARGNLAFYTETLGLRLVLKTVNQDDTSSYHLFYGDADGSPGSDVTFFDIPRARSQRPGTGLITGLSLRVRGAETLTEWARRLDEQDVRRTAIHERAGRQTLTLFDPEGQTLHLVNDGDETHRVPETNPWTDGPVSPDLAIQGLGPVELTVNDLGPTHRVLTEVLRFDEVGAYKIDAPDDSSLDHSIPSPNDASAATVFETGPGGVAAELHVVERPNEPRGHLGTGGVHHLALRTADGDSIRTWHQHLSAAGLRPSPVIDRHYFESIYVREPGGILIEIATDTGAPFPVDDAAAGRLSLPPRLESDRPAIEEALSPIGPPASNQPD